MSKFSVIETYGPIIVSATSVETSSTSTTFKVGKRMKGLIVGLVAGLCVLGIGCGAVSYGNDCARMEARIETQYKQNQNAFSSYFNTIKEMAQVPEMYTADLKSVYDGAIRGRYGADGAKQVMLFVKEHNPNLDPSMYGRIQAAIQSGRAKFEAEQKMLLDKKNTYEEMRATQPGKTFAWVLGYPKKDIGNMDIVIDDTTAKAFDTKRTEPIKLR